MDWNIAEERLKEFEGYAKDIPIMSGWFMAAILKQYRSRFDSGERSQELYDDIMGLEE